MDLRARIVGVFGGGAAGWLLRSGAGLGGMRIANTAIGLGTTVVLARSLGTEAYGLYIFALGWVYILGMPLQMGLPTLVMRQIAIYRSENAASRLWGIIRFAFALILGGSVLLGLLGVAAFAIGLAPGLLSDSGSLGLILAAYGLLVVFGGLALLRAIAGGCEAVVMGSLPDTLVRPCAFFLLVAVLASVGPLTPAATMAAHLAAAGLAMLVAAVIARRSVAALKLQANAPAVYETRSWLGALWPLTLQSGATLINNRLDIAMLGLIAGPSSVAIYDIAAKLASFLMLAQGIVNSLISPRVARLFSGGDRAAVQAVMQQACRLAFVPSVLLFAALLVAGPALVTMVFGEGFAASHGTALILGVGYLFSSGVGAVGVLLNMTGHERVTAGILLASAAINAGLNALLIPYFAVDGAAVATTVTVLFVQVSLWMRARDLTGIRADVFAPRALASAA